MSVIELETQLDQLQAMIGARKAELAHMQHQHPRPGPALVEAKQAELAALRAQRMQLDVQVAVARQTVALAWGKTAKVPNTPL